MNAEDPALPWRADFKMSLDIARRLARDACGLPAQHITALGEGWDFVTLLCDHEWVLRFPKRKACESVLLREQQLLEHLRRVALPVPIPHFEHLGAPSELYPWHFAVYRLLPGEPLIDHLDRYQPSLASALGEFLAVLHRTDMPLSLDNPWDDPEDDWKRREFDASQDAYPEALRVRFDAYLNLPADGELNVPHVITHADLNAEHILIDPDTGALTGIIDWTDACRGQRSVDFVGLHYHFGTDATHQAFEAYGDRPEGQEQRWLDRQALAMCIGQVHYGWRSNQPKFIAPALAAASRIFEQFTA